MKKNVQWLSSPTSSMSTVRKHFWTETMRCAGGCSSPMKYGVICCMPARREQDRGIVVRHERRRRHLAVTALREERDEAAAHLLAGYGRGHLQVTRHGSGEPHPFWHWRRVERQNSPGLPDQSRIVPDSSATGNATRTIMRRRWLARPWRTPRGSARRSRPGGHHLAPATPLCARSEGTTYASPTTISRVSPAAVRETDPSTTTPSCSFTWLCSATTAPGSMAIQQVISDSPITG